MRGVVITAIWLGIGFGITEFVASYLEARSVEGRAVHKLAEPERDMQAAGPARPAP